MTQQKAAERRQQEAQQAAPQYAPQPQTTRQPPKVLPKPPRVPGPPQLRLGPHKHATPATEPTPSLDEGDYANFPLKPVPEEYPDTDTGIYANLPPRNFPYENLPPRGSPQSGGKLNSQGLLPPTPPPRERGKNRMENIPGPPVEQTPGELPRPPTWLLQPSSGRPVTVGPLSPPPPSPQGRAGAPAGVPPSYDLFVGSQNVIGLNEQNFDSFIAPKELAMVMFYDPSNPNSHQPKEHFKKVSVHHNYIL